MLSVTSQSSAPQSTPESTRAIVLRAWGGAKGIRSLLALAFASLMHALGHAGLALLGGVVVVSLGGISPVHFGSTRGVSLDPVALATFAIGASLTRFIGSTLGSWVAARVVGDVSTTLRGHVLDALLAVHRLRHPRHADHGSPCEEAGAYASAVASLTGRVREVALGLQAGVNAARAAVQIVFLGLVLVLAAPRFFWVAVVVLAPFGWLLSRVRARIKRAQGAERAKTEALLEAADEAVRHADLWRSYGAERTIRAVIDDLGREARDRSARVDTWATAHSGANELLGVIAVAAGLFALAAYAPSDASRFAPFAVPFFLAYRPLRELAEARVALGRAEDAATALDEVLASARPSAPTSGREETWPLAPLDVRGLMAAHGTIWPLDLRVPPGEIVAVVGPTGAGKSTLLRLLVGLEPSTSGTVTYGGVALGDLPAGPTRPFAWSPQDAPVLASTVTENVFLGRDAEACDANAEVDALLAELGAETLRGLGETRLGASYRPLSGGERGLLSIARALASDAPVLLLDEPTSALDAATEARVLAALARRRGERTIVIVTHREAPCAIADVVVDVGGERAGRDHLGGRVVTGAVTTSGTQRKLSSKTLES